MKNILVTGCSRGIGYAIVKELVKDVNVKVYAVSRNELGLSKLQRECYTINNKEQLHVLSSDLSDLKNINNITNAIINNLNGKLDGIIHNAGHLVKKSFLDIKLNDLEDSFRINCFAPFLLTQKLLSHFKKNAHVVSISSMGGVQGSKKFPGLSVYTTSKASLITLTECLTEEFKMTDLIFNCLALGAVNTEMLQQAFPGYDAPLSAAQMGEFIVDFYLNGRKYFNGQVLPVSLTNP